MIIAQGQRCRSRKLRQEAKPNGLGLCRRKRAQFTGGRLRAIKIDCGNPGWAGSPLLLRPNQLTRINVKRFCELAKHTDACGNPSTLDRAHIAHAQLCASSQFFLRQVLIMAQATHVDRHDLFEVHGKKGPEPELSF